MSPFYRPYSHSVNLIQYLGSDIMLPALSHLSLLLTFSLHCIQSGLKVQTLLSQLLLLLRKVLPHYANTYTMSVGLWVYRYPGQVILICCKLTVTVLAIHSGRCLIKSVDLVSAEVNGGGSPPAKKSSQANPPRLSPTFLHTHMTTC